MLSGDRIGTIKNNKIDSASSCLFERVHHRAGVGVKPRADILNVKHQNVDSLQRLISRTSIRAGVKTPDRNSGCRIPVVRDILAVLSAGDPMLRRVKSLQADA